MSENDVTKTGDDTQQEEKVTVSKAEWEAMQNKVGSYDTVVSDLADLKAMVGDKQQTANEGAGEYDYLAEIFGNAGNKAQETKQDSQQPQQPQQQQGGFDWDNMTPKEIVGATLLLVDEVNKRRDQVYTDARKKAYDAIAQARKDHPDFNDYLPAIKALVNKDPSLSVSNAYKIAKADAKASKPSDVPRSISQTSSLYEPEKQAGSLEDAAKAALEELKQSGVTLPP